MKPGVPQWLCGVWTREYIQRFPGARVNNSEVNVLYIQTPNYHFDLRTALTEDHNSDAFAGFTRSGDNTVAWHSAFAKGTQVENPQDNWEKSLQEDHVTEDVGRIEKIDDYTWMEYHPNGDYEEKWRRSAPGEDMWAAISKDYTRL